MPSSNEKSEKARIKSARFVISNTKAEKCPQPLLPEYAFIGRSNVGKSSLINRLCNHQGLAKTSAKPGKTQLINHFIIDDLWYLVDLPGYGYAKVSKSTQAEFSTIILDYLKTRTNIMCLFVLIDIRLDPQPVDLRFLRFLGENQVPFVIAFTKGDKLPKGQLKNAATKYLNQLKAEWDPLPKHFITSAETGVGCPEIIEFIKETNKLFEKPRKA